MCNANIVLKLFFQNILLDNINTFKSIMVTFNVEENWVGESQNTVEGRDDGEKEDFEDIRWVDDVIEIE